MADSFDNPYLDLPDDPELAFLQLEAHFRADCERRLAAAGQHERDDVIYVDYIAQVLAAIQELNLKTSFRSEVPQIEDVNYGTYLNFNKDVKHFRTALEIRHGRRNRGYSVTFDEAAKTKIRHHLDQLQSIFDKLEIEERKREDLINKLDDLRNEVNRNRTHYDRLAAFFIDASEIAGAATERSKILDLLGAIGRVFWGAQVEEPKRLTNAAPKKRLNPPAKKTDLDDEIPF
jgi:hypothetical protein